MSKCAICGSNSLPNDKQEINEVVTMFIDKIRENGSYNYFDLEDNRRKIRKISLKDKYNAMLEKIDGYDALSSNRNQLILENKKLEEKNKQLEPQVSKLEEDEKELEKRLKLQKQQVSELTDKLNNKSEKLVNVTKELDNVRYKLEGQKIMSKALAAQNAILLEELYKHYEYDERKEQKPPKLVAIETELKKNSFSKFLKGKAGEENIDKNRIVNSKSANVKLPKNSNLFKK